MKLFLCEKIYPLLKSAQISKVHLSIILRTASSSRFLSFFSISEVGIVSTWRMRNAFLMPLLTSFFPQQNHKVFSHILHGDPLIRRGWCSFIINVVSQCSFIFGRFAYLASVFTTSMQMYCIYEFLMRWLPVTLQLSSLCETENRGFVFSNAAHIIGVCLSAGCPRCSDSKSDCQKEEDESVKLWGPNNHTRQETEEEHVT